MVTVIAALVVATIFALAVAALAIVAMVLSNERDVVSVAKDALEVLKRLRN